jgi:acylpyruvate hydrolase
MRLVTFVFQGQQAIGAQVGARILDFRRALPRMPADMIDFLALGLDGFARAGAALSAIDESQLIPENAVTLLAPVPRPGKILCVGHNYKGHIGIGRTELPEYPNMFCKTANTITGPNQPIRIPRVTQQVDYEAELAVIIGRHGRDIAESDAIQYVAGYSIFNDVSARDYQKRTSQWLLGKSFDTFGPLGPALVTTDEVPNPHSLDFELTVNGVAKQRANTSDIIFSVPFLVSYLSQVMPLEPGDIIAMGTPAKLPEAANPQVFLKPGDVVEITMDTLGVLANPVTA